MPSHSFQDQVLFDISSVWYNIDVRVLNLVLIPLQTLCRPTVRCRKILPMCKGLYYIYPEIFFNVFILLVIISEIGRAWITCSLCC